MTVRVRLAPSPTGNLHIGTARTAVFNWLFARHHGGQFILRIEDTDVERSRPEYTQNILDGLTWLGLTWDEGPFFQSERLDLYRQATQTLLDKGLAYRCYCTAEELEEMRAAQKANKEAPRYDNRHRDLTPEQQAAFEAQGRQPVIRFKIDEDRLISWNDLVRGQVTWKGSDLGGDMVIARAAAGGEVGQPLYNMAVVVDDIDMNITHVIRGEDHIANTAKQILLYEALAAAIPIFGHTPLILNETGQKLSKRDGVTSISEFHALGFTAEALANYMTLLGWTPPDSTQEIFLLPEAAKVFSFERVNKAGAKFDWAKLDWINSQYLHAMPVRHLTDLLIPELQAAGYKFDPVEDRVWLEQLAALIGPSLTRLKEAVDICQVFFTNAVEFDKDAATQIEKAETQTVLKAVQAALNGDKPLTYSKANTIIKQVTKDTKLKKGDVMKALRAALMGTMHGPDLMQSWVLLNHHQMDVSRFQQALKVNLGEVNAMAKTPAKKQPPAEQVAEAPAPEPRVIARGSDGTSEAPAIPPVPDPPTAEVAVAPEQEPPPAVSDSEAQAVPAEVEAPCPESPMIAEGGETPVPEPLETPVVTETQAPEPSAAVSESAAPANLVATETEIAESAVTPTVTETQAPLETITGVEMTSSEPPKDALKSAADQPDEQWQSIKNQVISILSDLPKYVGNFYQEYQRPILVIGLIISALIILKVILGLLEVVNEIPLLFPTFEIIGLGYSAWFTYRFLLRSSSRKELGQKVKALKEDIAGKK